MAEGGGGESQFIGKLLQKQTKYGTNSRSTQKNSVFAKHFIVKDDTLMGIALKYGVTVEEIKRENKLWTNDSLFLREHLLIPVKNDDVSSLPDNCEIVVKDNAIRSRSSSQISDTSAQSSQNDNVDKSANSTVSDKSVQDTASEIKKEESGMDFLSKYDTSIAKLKSNINQMEKNARSLPENVFDSATTYSLRKSSQRSSHNSNHRKGSFENGQIVAPFYENEGYSGSEKDLTNSPVLMIRTKTRKHKTSLDRIAKQNDEIFEL